MVHTLQTTRRMRAGAATWRSNYGLSRPSRRLACRVSSERVGCSLHMRRIRNVQAIVPRATDRFRVRAAGENQSIKRHF